MQPLADGWSSGVPRSKMDRAQFVHEPVPQIRATFFEKLRTQGQLLVHRQVSATPCAHLHQERNKLNGRFGEAVDRLLLMRCVLASADHASGDKTLQPADQDIRRNAFLGIAEEFAEMTAVAEHQIADDQKAPTVAQHL